MSLTRKMLAAMDIPAEKIDEIITAHTETVNALKEERDTAKAELDGMKKVEKELEKTTAELDKIKEGDWENKYNTIKGEYDSYKTDTENKAVKAAKVSAYTKLLKDAGVSEKRIDTVLKVSDVDSIEIDKDGNVKDADKLTESVKTEWADFIVTKQEHGADVSTPPANDGGSEPKKPSRAAQMAAEYRNEHYGELKED